MKQRRGSRHRRRVDEPAAQEDLAGQIADQLGIGVLMSAIEDGPPVRITATLVFGILQTEVTVEGSDEATAWLRFANQEQPGPFRQGTVIVPAM